MVFRGLLDSSSVSSSNDIGEDDVEDMKNLNSLISYNFDIETPITISMLNDIKKSLTKDSEGNELEDDTLPLADYILLNLIDLCVNKLKSGTELKPNDFQKFESFKDSYITDANKDSSLSTFVSALRDKCQNS
jgi:hypothetical protein